LLEGCPIVSAPTDTRALAAGARVPIPSRALLVAGAFSARLGARAVADAVSRGLCAGGAPEPDVALLGREHDAALSSVLAELNFDRRMRAARALILAVASLDPRTLVRGAAFELATRARQAGVPAYAIARESTLGSFDARLLDLQLVLVARTPRALASAGGRIAGAM
jgi:hypothetical protein